MREAVGVGYEGVAVEDFLDSMVRDGVTTLVDVRLNPLSRKRGFSKTALGVELRARGIEYIHMPELGNPRENRPGYGELESSSGEQSRATFVARLQSEDAMARIAEIVTLSNVGLVALLCFERDERYCHRQEILAAVQAQASDLIDAGR